MKTFRIYRAVSFAAVLIASVAGAGFAAVGDVVLKGHVLAINAQPIKGVAVALLGKGLSTLTDSIGYFEIIERGTAVAERFRSTSPSVTVKSGSVYLVLGDPAPVQVTVYSMSGKTVFHEIRNGRPGMNAVVLPIDKTGKGAYAVVVTVAGQRYSFKQMFNDEQTLSVAALNTPTDLSAAELASTASDSTVVDTLAVLKAGYRSLSLPLVGYIDSGIQITLLKPADTVAPVLTIDGYEDGDTVVVAEADSLSLQLEAVPAVADDSVAFGIVGSLPDSAVFDASSGRFFYVPGYSVATHAAPAIVTPVTFTAQGSVPGGAIAELTLYVKVINTNRKPVFTTIPTAQKIGLGNQYIVTLQVSDPDNDAVSLIAGNLGVINNVTRTLAWSAGYTICDSGSVRTFNPSVTDGEDTTSISWEVTVVAHQWTFLRQVEGLLGFTAYDSSVCHVLTEGFVTAYNEKLGTENQFRLSTDRMSASTYTNTGMRQFGNHLFITFGFTPGAGTEIVKVDKNLNFTKITDSVYVTAYGGNIVVSTRADAKMFRYSHHAYMTSSSSVWDYSAQTATDLSASITSATAMNAAYSGVNMFICGNNNTLMRKYGSGGSWTAVSTARAYNEVEPGSSTGDTTYLLSTTANSSGNLYRLTGGTSPTVSVSQILNAPLALVDLESMNSKVMWGVDSYGTLYFTAYGFADRKYSIENFNGEKISMVVVSEDRKTVYAVTDTGKIYRY